MEKINSISDTGPIIYLSKLNLIKLLEIFSPVGISPEVRSETSNYKISVPVFLKTLELNAKTKDFVELLILQFELDLGEAEGLALIRQEGAKLFFTDDLDAREAAKQLGVSVHGTIGILIRGYREGKLSKNVVIEKLRALKNTGFFITSDLIEQAIKAVENYKK